MKLYTKILLIFTILIALLYALLWFLSIKKYPIEYGISFNQDYAGYLGLPWQQVYLDMLTDLKPKYVRVAAMWSEVEKEKGNYDFTNVDWMLDRAAEKGVKVTLVIGQKAPRWPECHVPVWTNGLVKNEYDQKLLSYVRAVTERYKNHPALEWWQVENEPYIRFVFGDCVNFDAELLPKEIGLIKLLDLNHQILVTDSGELSTWQRASRVGDVFGTTMYRVVRTWKNIKFTYDWLPPAFYRFKARFWGLQPENTIISELQAEPWFSTVDVLHSSLDQQLETFDLARMNKNFVFASQTGFSRAYLWGVEWWYWMKEVNGDASYWNRVVEELAKTKK